MSKTEWGVKRLCATCAAPFYDLHRYPVRCPKCDAVFRPSAPTARRAAVKRPAPAKRGWPKVVTSEEPVPEPSAGSPPQRATDIEDDDEVEVDQGGEEDEVLEHADDDEAAEDIDGIKGGANPD
jgi:uncharacterized protein (TIGR02300 family)